MWQSGSNGVFRKDTNLTVNNPLYTTTPLASSTFAMLVLCLAALPSAYADIGDTRNFYQFDEQVLSSGQPKTKQLKRAADDGIEVVINIVDPSESIYNRKEREILEAQGIQYLHTPVDWDDPKDSEIEAFLSAMDAVGDRKVLVHCWANARASALVHVYEMSQSSENRVADYEELKQVWDDVAGFDLDRNPTWKKVIEQYAVESE